MFSLAEAKAQMNVTVSDDDEYISRLIDVVTKTCEAITHRAITRATKTETLDAFAWEIVLPVVPVVSVTSVKYDDANDAEQTVSASAYRVDTRKLRTSITPSYNNDWPSDHDKAESVRVEYEVGYVTVPEDMKQAGLMLLSSLYEQRENHSESTLNAVPFGVDMLLAAYRVPTI